MTRAIPPRLAATRCGTCGRISIPPRAHCHACGAADVERMEIAAHGVVAAATVVHRAPLGHDAPYALALVRLDHGAAVLARGETAALLAEGDIVRVLWDEAHGMHRAEPAPEEG